MFDTAQILHQMPSLEQGVQLLAAGFIYDFSQQVSDRLLVYMQFPFIKHKTYCLRTQELIF